MKMKLFTLALGCLLLTSCLDEKALLQKMIPRNEDDDARHFIDLIRTGDYSAAQLLLAPDLQGDKASQALTRIHDKLLHGEPLKIETIGCNVSVNSSATQTSRRTSLSYEIQFSDSWVLSNVLLDQKSDGTIIAGFHFYPEQGSMKSRNRFTLIGKSPIHYAVLALCIAIPVFILYTLIVCIITPVRRKWLWIIFILLGLVQFRFNWTTGLSDVQPISILLLGSGYHADSPFSPWVLQWALPVGALVFLLRRRKLMANSFKPPVRNQL